LRLRKKDENKGRNREIPVCTQDHTAFDTMHQARKTKEIMEMMVED